MKTLRFLLFSAVCLVFLGCLTLFAWGHGLVGDIDSFRLSLEEDGFTVQEGKLETFNIFDMYDAGYISSCYGNNAQAPYMVYKLPKAPGQETPNTVSDAPLKPENLGLWEDYRLRFDEAIVFIGPTPPECRYFSYRSYLVMRRFPEDDQARRIFASLGDTLNQFTIQTTGTPGGKEGDAYNSTTVIITAADRTTEQRVRKALQSAGYSMDIVNTDVIPQKLVNMGLEMESDTFGFIHRTAFFEDEQTGAAYMESHQGTVFRLTPQEIGEPDPIDMPPLRVRGTGSTHQLELAGAVEELRQAILSKYRERQATELTTSIWIMEGFDALQRGIDVAGENRDTTYLWTEPFFLDDDPQEFLIVYGVNHTTTGKALYNNLVVYGYDIMNGVAQVENQQLEGTAEAYLPDHPQAQYLYVWKIARAAGDDPHGLEVPTGPGAYGIPLEASCFIAFRSYLEKETQVGPFWSEILYDQAIKFSP